MVNAEPRIAVIDYGAGNLRSVVNAFEAIGSRPVIATRAEELEEADGIVLPGVGAFGDGMANLHKLGIIPALTEQVKLGKPYLGICLGMQFLAERSFEGGEVEGFGWLKGCVKRIETGSREFKVPHMGWNNLSIVHPGGLFADLEAPPTFYFVHSYALVVDPSERDIVTSTCWHGTEIVCSIEMGNVYGVQFHPEKSQLAGLSLLKNYLRIATSSVLQPCSKSD